MAIIIGKLVQRTFSSEDGEFHLYRAKAGGESFTAVYIGQEAPQARKTVEVVLFGAWKNHPRYGRQFQIRRFERYTGQTPSEEQEREIIRHLKQIVGGES